MTTPSLIDVEHRGAAAWVTLRRPEAANALSRKLVAELRAVAARLHRETQPGARVPPVRAVVITGVGNAFCAGADLKERLAMSRDETRTFLDELGAAVDAVAALPAPVIAAVNGAAFGGGLELALACDLRVAADGVSVGLVETRLGIIPGAGGTQRLARLIGTSRAKELIFTGRRIDAATAKAMGLVTDVVPGAELVAAVDRLVDEIAGAGPLAVAEAKAAIDGGVALGLAEGLAHERRCYEAVLASADRDEGLRAFAEKRAPVFRGH